MDRRDEIYYDKPTNMKQSRELAQTRFNNQNALICEAMGCFKPQLKESSLKLCKQCDIDHGLNAGKEALVEITIDSHGCVLGVAGGPSNKAPQPWDVKCVECLKLLDEKLPIKYCGGCGETIHYNCSCSNCN